MSLNPRDLFRGSLIVASRDLRANAHGLKVWMICGLTLLAVLGAAFGIGGLTSQGPSLASQYVLWSSAYFPANNSSVGIIVWTSDYLGNPRVGETIYLWNSSQPSVEKARITTNATGWGRFPGLATGIWRMNYTVGASNRTAGITLPDTRPTKNLSVMPNYFDIIGDGARRDVSIHAMWADGTPAIGAQVTANGTSIGTTDQNGFFHHRFKDGTWAVTVAYRGELETLTIPVETNPSFILPYLQGPNALLLFLGVALMGLFAPIIAIAMSYDAVAKERMQGSLELLLARPASRTGIAVGKFLGSFLSVGLPMLGVLLGAVAGVAATSGKWPDAMFTLAFVVGTLGLIAIYVLLMQVFSTLAKSAGTAILSGFVVWIVFNIVWNLVLIAVEAALNIEGGTPAAFTLSAITTLFNPNGVYQLTVTTFVPASALGLFGTTGGGSLPDWTGPVTMLVWIIVLLILAVAVFRKRIV
jgi:ABC-type transport system involved in multi-copper enzyme maturation permease subunit